MITNNESTISYNECIPSDALSRSETIRAFLQHRESPHARHFHPGLELQVDPVSAEERDATGLTDNLYPIRVPKYGNSQPEDNDRKGLYPTQLIQRLGTSGWNWRDRRSEFVVFDFDGKDHGDKGLDQEDLKALQDAVTDLDYVAVYTSKGGVGLHFYVYLAGHVEVAVRSDHKLVAHAVLEQMTSDTGIDLSKYVDVFGGIVWLWDRNAKPEGFREVKEATDKLTLPDDWKEKAKVTAKQRTKSSQSRTITRRLESLAACESEHLDEKHHRLLDWMEKNGWFVSYEPWGDSRLIHLHTAGLKSAHEALGLPGVFDTVSTGTDPGKPNAFAFPRPEGGLVVYRFGKAQEADCWTDKPGGGVYCIFGTLPTFDDACRAVGGTANQRGEFMLSDEGAWKALQMLDLDLEIPEQLCGREVVLKLDRETIFATIRAQGQERYMHRLGNWSYHRMNWEYTVDGKLPPSKPPTLDDCIRRTVSGGKGEAWYLLDADARWQQESLETVKTIVGSVVGRGRESDQIITHHIQHSWTITSIPFADEYPGGVRIWNRNGVRLAFDPEPGEHPHWNKVLSHCGQGLDSAVAENPWCREHGLRTGGDYLKMHMASLIRRPATHLPYLFFFSWEQNTGKSTFYRAFSLLIEDGRGCVEVSRELRGDFNDLMNGAVMCFIEETNLGKNYAIYDTLKNFVDTNRIKLRPIYKSGEMATNYCHFVQCANDRSYCPVYPGDSRIVVIPVPTLDTEIPWQSLKTLLREEAPAFLHSLMTMNLPTEGDGRLYLPVLETPDKREAMDEMREEMGDWYHVLRDMALRGEVRDVTAMDLMPLLVEAGAKRGLPANAGALARKISGLESRLSADGFQLKVGGGKKTKYTIERKELTSCTVDPGAIEGGACEI